MGKLFAGITTALGMTGAVAVYIGFFVGWADWMRMSIHLGSFLVPLSLPVSLLGIWSFLFGLPLWLFNLVT